MGMNEPSFDRNGYPTNGTLETLEKWEISGDFNAALAAFVSYFEGAWNMHYGAWRRRGSVIIVSTGGWSGNEDVINAVMSNHMFVSLCWQKSERGGRYTFVIPVVLGA